ncbi:MAG: choice-of-anchor B family protein [Phycisphaeraceae bacterium]|nr:choice-of-anchor B family protein [Phycisphaeraceae bacterium]
MTMMMPRSIAASLSAAMLAAGVLGHADDPKAKHWEPPVVAPAWRLGIEGASSEGGVAESFTSDGVQLLSWFPVTTFGTQNTSGNDCWGYVSPSGREYALMGLSHGTGIVEITNPEQAQIVAFLPGPQSLWRNIKTYKNWMYAVSEGGGGIQVFDLSLIDAGLVTTFPSVTTGGTQATHTMIINEKSGYLYRMGGGSNGLRIYNLEPNPAQPQFVASWPDRYVHDGYVVTYESGPYAGREVFFACGGFNSGHVDTGVTIIDVTNKSSLQVMSQFYYPNAAYSHQLWPSEDLQFAYLNDEIDEQNHGLFSVGRIIDISNLSQPTLAGTYTTGLQTVDHNEYVRGDLLFCSNYKSGLRIFDISNRTNPVEVAWFDTYPENDTAGYAGLWSNYPFFPSGTVIGSDLQRGLFVWRISNETLAISYPNGVPSLVSPAGQSITVQITPIAGAEIEPGTAKMIVTGAGAPIEVPMSPVGGELWSATVPSLPCGTKIGLRFTAKVAGGVTVSDPAAPGAYSALIAVSQSMVWDDDFESDKGWTYGVAGDTATGGVWERGNPIGTTAQPNGGHQPEVSGPNCAFTGQHPGGGAGANDVDNGITTLISPVFGTGGADDIYFTAFVWYSNDKGANPGVDVMPVHVSNNGGATWTLITNINNSTTSWVPYSWRLADYVPLTENMRVRFRAQDLGAQALVEAAVDTVAIVGYGCTPVVPGDLNGDGVVNGADIALLLGNWGGSGTGDLNGDGTVDGSDLAILLGNWS